MKSTLTVLFTCCWSIATASVIHVPADQPTIQGGINAAFNGDTVVVADGTYTGTGNTNLLIVGKSLALQSQNGSAACIIDLLGASGARAITCSLATSVSIDGFTITESAAEAWALRAKLSSVTMSNCLITSGGSREGTAVETDSSDLHISLTRFEHLRAGNAGGGAITLSSSEATITDCVFDDVASISKMVAMGGAIHVGKTSSITLTNSTFRNCVAREFTGSPTSHGGALFCDSGSTVVVTNSAFLQNGAHIGTGGAIFSARAGLLIEDCIFRGNGAYTVPNRLPVEPMTSPTTGVYPIPFPSASHSGAAVYALLSDMQLYRCIFDSNVITGALDACGGSIVVDRSNVQIGGCTFINNLARAGQAIFTLNSSLRIDSSIIAFNRGSSATTVPIESDTFPNVSIAISCTDIYGNYYDNWAGCVDSLQTLYNNFSLDPQFCGRTDGNFMLQEDSPCRPELSPCGSLVGALPVQPGCNSCCEGTTGNANLAGGVDLSDLSLLIAYLTLSPKPGLPCPAEANINAAGAIDLSDLSGLIAYVTTGAYTLPWCP